MVARKTAAHFGVGVFYTRSGGDCAENNVSFLATGFIVRSLDGGCAESGHTYLRKSYFVLVGRGLREKRTHLLA